MKGDSISHEEIWDDSALQNSWDDALAEYKKYHSMAAKGEQVNLNQLAIHEQTQGNAKASFTSQQAQLPNGEINATTEHSHTAAGAEPESQPAVVAAATPIVSNPASASTGQVGAGAMPQALLNSVQDEGLKNLMMSWYYAGYYTGLLEGQQKAHASMQQGG